MKYYIIAGEASGDMHGANLMKEIRKLDEDAAFRFFGGDKMQAIGGTLVKHYRELAFMGFLDVILHLRTIKQNLSVCKKDLLDYRPDVLILIDYPGFNLRIAEFAKQNNITVFYYISPKLWAWKEYRVKKIKAWVDEMFTIFPFETEFYNRHGVDVHFVGNPLLDALDTHRQENRNNADFQKDNGLDARPKVALLAGSRVKEIKRILPVMIQASEGYNEFQFVVAGLRQVDSGLYREICQGSNIPVIYDKTYTLLDNSFAALVASGTASLETALLNVPQTVLYKVEGGLLVDVIMRNFVLKTRWVSLPNIILQKTAVKELLQKEMTLKRVRDEMDRLLYDYEYRNKIIEDYAQLRKVMGEPGCSARAAEKMWEILNNK